MESPGYKPQSQRNNCTQNWLQLFARDTFQSAHADPAKSEVLCHFLPFRGEAYYGIARLQQRPQAYTVAHGYKIKEDCESLIFLNSFNQISNIFI